MFFIDDCKTSFLVIFAPNPAKIGTTGVAYVLVAGDLDSVAVGVLAEKII